MHSFANNMWHKPLNIVLIIVIQLTVSSLELFAQTYLHEPTIWRQYWRTGSSPYTYEEDYTLELKGDTLINNKLYFKVLRSGIRTVTNSYSGAVESPIYEYVNPIREEDQKFFRYNINLEKEELLHNFDLSVGDTAHVINDGCHAYYPHHHIVRWIDTVYIGNIPRKRFHFTSSIPIVALTEGVGSYRGLQYSPCFSYTINYLQCYVQDQAYIQFETTQPVDCNSLIVVSTENATEQDFTLYPNPFTEEINIQTPSVITQELNVVVTNLLGTIIYQTQIDVFNEIVTIHPGDIPSGLYVVWLSSKDATSAFKILKL